MNSTNSSYRLYMKSTKPTAVSYCVTHIINFWIFASFFHLNLLLNVYSTTLKNFEKVKCSISFTLLTPVKNTSVIENSGECMYVFEVYKWFYRFFNYRIQLIFWIKCHIPGLVIQHILLKLDNARNPDGTLSFQ